MAIDPKKYTRAELAKMVEDAQRSNGALEVQISGLCAQIDKKNDALSEYANEKEKLKADADVLRSKLADTEAALGRANAEVSRLTHDLTVAKNVGVQYASVFKYAVEHPFETLWEWIKRKVWCAE